MLPSSLTGSSLTVALSTTRRGTSPSWKDSAKDSRPGIRFIGECTQSTQCFSAIRAESRVRIWSFCWTSYGLWRTALSVNLFYHPTEFKAYPAFGSAHSERDDMHWIWSAACWVPTLMKNLGNFKSVFPRPGENHRRFWSEFACSSVLTHCIGKKLLFEAECNLSIQILF